MSKFFIGMRSLRHLFWACAVAAAACGQIPDRSADAQAAEQHVAAIYQAIEAKDFSKAAAMYSPLFYKEHSEDEWAGHLQELNKQLGDLQSFRLTKVISNSNFSGVFLTLKYKTHYSKHDAFEQFVFTTPPGGGKLQVVSHKVDIDTFNS